MTIGSSVGSVNIKLLYNTLALSRKSTQDLYTLAVLTSLCYIYGRQAIRRTCYPPICLITFRWKMSRIHLFT